MRRAYGVTMAALTLLLVVAGSARAGIEVRNFPDKATEQRYEKLTHELRCLVCQNETIAASNADLAKDLRQEIYEQIQAGQSDKQIIDFMVARYGDFVLYKPPFKPETILLWLGPFLMLATGLVILFVVIRRHGGASPVAVAADELDRARKILNEGKDNP